jgi:hypothetical protein
MECDVTIYMEEKKKKKNKIIVIYK